MNDQGYKSVLKEYDFYNINDNDFEIIDEIGECQDNFINTLNDYNKHNNNLELKKYNVKLQTFIINIFKTIFNSRNKKSEFSSKSKNKLSDNKKDNSFFTVDIEELIEYDNLKARDNSNIDNKKKYIIDFYLYKNDDNHQEKDMLKSVRITDKPKILVERWKIKYKEDFYPAIDNKNDINNFELFLDKKLKILEKNIMTYSRILPMFNISKDENYFVDFKFNPSRKSKKKFIDEDKTEKIKLVNDNIFWFKLSISYLRINPENIEKYFKSNISDFVIIPSNKSRRRFLSQDTNDKKPSTQFLNDLEHKSKDKIHEDKNNKEEEMPLIIEDYIKDKRERRLSYDEKNIKKYINTKFFEINKNGDYKDKELLSDKGSEEDLSLVITETNNDTCQNSIDNYNINNNLENYRKLTDNNKQNKKQVSCFRKCHTYMGQSKNNLNEEDKDKNFDKIKNIGFIENSVIKNIILDYQNTRKMLKKMPKYGNINHSKLLTFISSS